MDSLLNHSRPPIFCPGCAHERITTALDQAFQMLALSGNQVAIVSDIGCSGLFDTFFNTHAMHGLHGRALTYAAGIRLSKPDLNVVVTMGDGGQGIGGAHLLAACRRNLNLTLLVLNNYNFGMTGGQFSATTPADAQVSSAFLNRLEQPLDICQVAQSAGAAYVRRCSSYQKDLPRLIAEAIQYDGFAVVDIWGICPGRFSRNNQMTPRSIAEHQKSMPPAEGVVSANQRAEYGRAYRQTAASLDSLAPPINVEKQFEPLISKREEVIILGDAGQRIITAGEILCLAGMTAGLKVSQKNEYNITVLRGPSISDVILTPGDIGYTGIGHPRVILALSQEGIDRRKAIFSRLDQNTIIYQLPQVTLPSSEASRRYIDFKGQKIKPQNWALAGLAILAKQNRIIDLPMLKKALAYRFDGDVLKSAIALVDSVNFTDE